jgi:hypothetical protein
MTDKNRELASEYFGILSDGHASSRLAHIADTTDRAIEAMLEVFKAAGLNFPGDDRCAEIELAVYATAKRVNA